MHANKKNQVRTDTGKCWYISKGTLEPWVPGEYHRNMRGKKAGIGLCFLNITESTKEKLTASDQFMDLSCESSDLSRKLHYYSQLLQMPTLNVSVNAGVAKLCLVH